MRPFVGQLSLRFEACTSDKGPITFDAISNDGCALMMGTNIVDLETFGEKN